MEIFLVRKIGSIFDIPDREIGGFLNPDGKSVYFGWGNSLPLRKTGERTQIDIPRTVESMGEMLDVNLPPVQLGSRCETQGVDFGLILRDGRNIRIAGEPNPAHPEDRQSTTSILRAVKGVKEIKSTNKSS